MITSDGKKNAANSSSTADDVFLAVGLDSGLTDFKRPKLNLGIILDISGSMDSRFSDYYYDQFKDGGKKEAPMTDEGERVGWEGWEGGRHR